MSKPPVSSTSADIDRRNLRVIEYLGNWLNDLGFSTELTPLPGRPDKTNLIATPAPASRESKGGLVLAGHTDTVPVDESLWQSDPFILNDTDDVFYGLGSCDMKGFFPVALKAAATFAKGQPSAPLTIVATFDEESSMAGDRYLVESGRSKADCAIAGETTELQPTFAHKGISMMSINILGSTGHASDPSLGNNALDAMHNMMSALLDLRAELVAANKNDAFAVNVPTMNMGCMRAGDNPNRICGHANLQIDLRLLPGVDSEEIHAELEQRIQKAVADSAVTLTLNKACPPIPPFATIKNGDLVQTLSSLGMLTLV